MPTTRLSARRTAAAAAAPPSTGGLTAFVTVGTTRFDALVAAVNDPAFEAALLGRGYTRLVVQAGAGATRAPDRLLPPGVTDGVTKAGLTVSWFDYAPSLAALFEAADLVVSHAGAGSVFEALTARAALIAVPNPALMHNHQAELADQLAGDGVCVAATAEGLAAAVADADFDALRPYEAGEAAGIVAAVDELAGRGRGRGGRGR
jgi:beta-1,4-N-acetylglucosaminyltransferase